MISSVGLNAGMSSIMPMGNKSVIIDGKRHNVIKVQDNNMGVKTLMPTYKEVVVVDGEQYDVKTTSDPFSCGLKKEVVVIDGKQYTVRGGGNIGLGVINGINGNFNMGSVANNSKYTYFA